MGLKLSRYERLGVRTPVVLLNHFDRHSSMYVSARAKRNCRDLEQYAGDLPI